MTNYQNRRRWAIDQQKKARALMATELETAQQQKAQQMEWLNMFFGNLLARTMRGEA